MRFATVVLTAALSLLLVNCAHEYNNRPSVRAETRRITGRLSRVALADSPQDNAPAQDQGKAPTRVKSARRLESFRWDPVKRQFTWEVSKGQKEGSSYKPSSTDRYDIDMDKATMTFNGETRRFSEEEAANVQALMGMLSQYAVESTVWWEDGQGDPVDDKGGVAKPGQGTPKNPAEKALTRRSLFDRLASLMEGLQPRPPANPRIAS